MFAKNLSQLWLAYAQNRKFSAWVFCLSFLPAFLYSVRSFWSSLIQMQCGSSSAVHFFCVCGHLTPNSINFNSAYIRLHFSCVLFDCVLFHFLLFLLATVCAICLLLPFKINVHAAMGRIYDAIISSNNLKKKSAAKPEAEAIMLTNSSPRSRRRRGFMILCACAR